MLRKHHNLPTTKKPMVIQSPDSYQKRINVEDMGRRAKVVKFLSYRLTNSATSGSHSFVLFDAFGAYAEVNTVAEETAQHSLELLNGNEAMLKEALKQMILRCNKITFIGSDASVIERPLEPFSHALEISRSIPLTPIHPNQGISSAENQPNIKTVETDLVINGATALTYTVDAGKSVTIQFYLDTEKTFDF